MNLTADLLRTSLETQAAFRRRRRLQPIEGPGAKIFPPTYPGSKKDEPQHVFERRRIDGQDLWCVLVDSVQSQSNRLEEFLLEAARQNAIELPYVSVDFSDAHLDGLSEITSLEAPHRLFDAILRDSEIAGTPFMRSEKGKALIAAKSADASAIFELSPTALLFGVWNSTGEGGGLGAKFPRCLVSELIGVNVPVDEEKDGEIRSAGRRTGSRIDPLGVLRRVEVFKSKEGWDVDQKKAGKEAKKVRPSEINHGNIAPTVQNLGVTCEYIEQTSVVTLAGLRRLRFGSGDRTAAGRTLLAALGLVALLEQDVRGFALRSRCDLVCDGTAPLDLVKLDGSTEQIDLNLDAARAVYAECVAAVRKTGFTFSSEPLKLKPQAKLVQIVQRSRELALAGEGGEASEAAG